MGPTSKKAVSDCKNHTDHKANETRPSTKKSPAATGSSTTASRPSANRPRTDRPAAPARDREKGKKHDDGPKGAGTGVDAGGSSSRSRTIRSKGSPSMEENYDDFYDDTTMLQEGISINPEEEGEEEADYNTTSNRKRSHRQHLLGSTWPSRPTSPLPDGPPLVDTADTEEPARKRPAIGIAGTRTDDKSTADEEEVRWSEQLHRELVDAIYEIGVSHASPSVIIENMVLLADVATAGNADPNQNPVTSERVKSHLQKYRKNKTKSQEEFLQEYDHWMQKALTMVGGVSAAARTSLVSTPTAVIEMVGGRRNKAANDSSSVHSIANRKANETYKARNLVLGGALPAFLTYSIMLEDEHALIMRQRKALSAAGLVSSSHSNLANTQQSQSPRSATGVSGNTSATVMGHLPSSVSASMPSASEYTQYYSGTRISIPSLTDEERKSSLGVSISHVVGLFHSITHHLMKERDTAPSSERSE